MDFIQSGAKVDPICLQAGCADCFADCSQLEMTCVCCKTQLLRRKLFGKKKKKLRVHLSVLLWLLAESLFEDEFFSLFILSDIHLTLLFHARCLQSELR